MILRFFVYGALGWCGEIIWTAVMRRALRTANNWLLMGETSLWVFPLYGLGGLLFEILHSALSGQFILVRASVYLAAFWILEYIGGWLIWRVTRVKPWDYSRSPGGSLNGLIRWNFVLVWPVVGLAVERFQDWLVALTAVP